MLLDLLVLVIDSQSLANWKFVSSSNFSSLSRDVRLFWNIDVMFELYERSIRSINFRPNADYFQESLPFAFSHATGTKYKVLPSVWPISRGLKKLMSDANYQSTYSFNFWPALSTLTAPFGIPKTTKMDLIFPLICQSWAQPLGVLVIGGARGSRPGRPIVKGVRGQGSEWMTNAPITSINWAN